MTVKKFTLAFAVMAMLAVAFVGVTDVDAADSAVSLDDEWSLAGVTWSNDSLGNDLTVAGDTISGTVAKADADQIKALWGASATEEHVIIMTVTVAPGCYVVWEASDGSGIKSVKAESDGKVILAQRLAENVTGFTYAVSATDVTDDAVYDALLKSTVKFDVELLGDAVNIYYTVGDLTYIQKSIAKQTYTLVSMDDLRAVAPEGEEFSGWAWDGKVLDAGTILTLEEGKADAFYTFTATFEEIPVQEVFKVEFVVDGIVVQTCQSDNVVVPANPSKEGFKFTAWTVDGVMANPTNYAYSEDVRFTAAFEAYTYSVTFIANGEVVGTPQTVKHGDLILAPGLPAGYESWAYDFTKPITEDTIIVAVEAPAPEPTGLDKTSNQIIILVLGFIVVIGLAVGYLKRDEISAGIVKKLDKKEEEKDE